MILSPLKDTGRDLGTDLVMLMKQGYSRVLVKKEVTNIDELLHAKKLPAKADMFLLIDRVKTKNGSDNDTRLADSIQTAFFEGNGTCIIAIQMEDNELSLHHFSNRFECDGIKFEEPTPHMFSFNSPLGACPTCEGFGKVMGIDPDLVVPNKNLSVYQDAVACWRGDKLGEWKDQVVFTAILVDFPIHRPYYQLSNEQKKILWNGCDHFQGINQFFKMVEENLYKVQYRVLLSRFRGKTTCPMCDGK
jgi:excinuclease ABC subunit A